MQVKIQELLIHKYSYHSGVLANCAPIMSQIRCPPIHQTPYLPLHLFTIHSVTLNQARSPPLRTSSLLRTVLLPFPPCVPAQLASHLNPTLSLRQLKHCLLQESFPNPHTSEVKASAMAFCLYLHTLPYSFHSCHVSASVHTNQAANTLLPALIHNPVWSLPECFFYIRIPQ